MPRDEGYGEERNRGLTRIEQPAEPLTTSDSLPILRSNYYTRQTAIKITPLKSNVQPTGGVFFSNLGVARNSQNGLHAFLLMRKATSYCIRVTCVRSLDCVSAVAYPPV